MGFQEPHQLLQQFHKGKVPKVKPVEAFLESESLCLGSTRSGFQILVPQNEFQFFSPANLAAISLIHNTMTN
jgi:hypothetical protein